VIRLSSPETDAPAAPDVDEVRQAQLDAFTAELGDAVLGSFILRNDLTLRIATEAWTEAARVARRELHYGYFCFLSAIDWRPSPFGRYEDAEVDNPLHERLGLPWDLATGTAGGETRYQVFARVEDVVNFRGVTLKVDVPEDTLTVGTWRNHYAGADWHERETHEMFGIDFAGHPDLRNLYLPGDFEGYPLRKDYPLLARVVKPWPGIVDVEPMPGEDEGDAEADAAAAAAEGGE
jgi:NADH-quinone oxidoreductase subunit C